MLEDRHMRQRAYLSEGSSSAAKAKKKLYVQGKPCSLARENNKDTVSPLWVENGENWFS